MVDCITPATGEREYALAVGEFGIEDASPVVCESFRQWVMEDHFTAGRPSLENVGVEFVSDVAPYELMKLRILNGGHAAIAYAGALRGHQFAHDAMADPLMRAFLETLERREIIPTVPPISGVDYQDYLTSVMDRFANPKTVDAVDRLCLDGSNRQPKFIVPTIVDRLKDGLPINGLALEIALRCRYCDGTREDGSPITIDDQNAERLGQFARRAKDDPAAFLAMDDIFGSLGGNENASRRSRGPLNLSTSTVPWPRFNPFLMVVPVILCNGEALIDFLPVKTDAGDLAFQPFNGGSVYNVAIALGRLGINVGFFGGLSNDLFGRSLREGLRASNVDLSFALQNERSSTLAFVKFDGGDAEYAFVDDGSVGRMLMESDIPDLPASVTALHFGSISLIPDPGGATFETMAVQNADKRLISFDPNIRPDQIRDRDAYLRRFEAFVGCAHILKLSDADLDWLAPGANAAEAARDWIGRGVGLVVLTRGGEGAIAFTADETVECQPARVDVVDTIGAGDTFMAGLLAHFETAGALAPEGIAALDGETLTEALNFATRAASVTVSRAGANPPWSHELSG